MDKLPGDLKVTLQRYSIVVPAEKTQKRCMFLSNIDRTLNFNVETIHFFPPSLHFPPEMVAEKLEDALKRLLGTYDFLAGRLRLDSISNRLEVDCNSAGAGFVVASSELTLAQLGNLVYPNPAFRQLILESLPNLAPEDQPLFLLQVTRFKCGSFALSISNNHALMDGISFKIFLENLASLMANKPLAITPHNDRHLLAARSPPRVTFSHPELLEMNPIEQQLQLGHEDSNAKLFQSTLENLDIKVFHLSGEDIAKFKEKAKMSSGGGEGFKITSFNVVMAHIWRCKALSVSGGETIKNKKTSTILYAVDLRPRLRPPLPQSYTGNAVITAYATATIGDLENGPFSKLAEFVSQGAARITDEYARSVIDWGELHQEGFPYGDVLVSSWWKLGFDQVEYPWGRPNYSCPLVHHRKDIILLFPDNEGEGNGVNILVALPTKDMEIFQSIFYHN